MADQAEATERTSLLTREPHLIEQGAKQNSDDDEARNNHTSFMGILSLLLIGVFIANADTSLVLATYTNISSEFDAFNNASWLLSGYMLSMCTTQPLYGKLSNIFGRKPLLLLAYALFALGNLLSGLSKSIEMVIVGRIIGGIGGAGMSTLVSFLIADMVPVRQVASYRSYVNVVQTIGRSCGGPLGGKLAESLGWRWSYFIQTPFALLAITLVQINLHVPKLPFQGDSKPSIKAQLMRIDFLGAFLISTSILSFLLAVSMGGNQLEWTHPAIPALLAFTVVLALIFSHVETKVALEPIFPLNLLAQSVIMLNYGIILLQNMAQTIMMFVVPLYFQVTAKASPSEAGLHLVPAILGNTVGGLATGLYINRTGRYKLPNNMAAIMACACHALMFVRWTGNTGIFESSCIFLGGLGTGMAQSSTFIAITAKTTNEELAIAGAGLYLSGGLGSVLGVATSSSTMRVFVKKIAMAKLVDNPSAGNIVKKVLSDVNYIFKLNHRIKQDVLDAYIWAFRVNFALAFLCCMVSLLLGIFLREQRLQ